MSETSVKKADRTRVLTLTALFTGMNIALEFLWNSGSGRSSVSQ